MAYNSMEVGVAKNPHAVALSKLGASKGGKARAASLTKERRSEIARNAVKARMAKRNGIHGKEVNDKEVSA